MVTRTSERSIERRLRDETSIGSFGSRRNCRHRGDCAGTSAGAPYRTRAGFRAGRRRPDGGGARRVQALLRAGVRLLRPALLLRAWPIRLLRRLWRALRLSPPPLASLLV